MRGSMVKGRRACSTKQINEAVSCLRLDMRQMLGSLRRLEVFGLDLGCIAGLRLIALDLDAEVNRWASAHANSFARAKPRHFVPCEAAERKIQQLSGSTERRFGLRKLERLPADWEVRETLRQGPQDKTEFKRVEKNTRTRRPKSV